MIKNIVPSIGNILVEKGWTMGTAESCTGGLVAATLTDFSGSSAWFSGAVIAYSNEIKMSLLQVPESVIIEHGAVSEPTVRAMAQGVCKTLNVNAGISISGIAGPSGGTRDKPVGTVWMGWHVNGKTSAEKYIFSGDRMNVKQQSLQTVLEKLLEILKRS
ncbi:CinA family protein [Maridesulfovibrio hydrothermalis]|uniref:CinA domain protein n=1 Tax=Maridesulfovibrio hydrothermalis AM13 = DSM 14728 TaxID=1121451 RepID=L0R7G5_9BACT|nr:CinA family protein [Maridesulfovibrio hydrothermalis]CCO22679.1 CinA domain protein [Maridesulfovibrio hydrothermalis AM13 = DSM 14728]